MFILYSERDNRFYKSIDLFLPQLLKSSIRGCSVVHCVYEQKDRLFITITDEHFLWQRCPSCVERLIVVFLAVGELCELANPAQR